MRWTRRGARGPLALLAEGVHVRVLLDEPPWLLLCPAAEGDEDDTCTLSTVAPSGDRLVPALEGLRAPPAFGPIAWLDGAGVPWVWVREGRHAGVHALVDDRVRVELTGEISFVDGVAEANGARALWFDRRTGPDVACGVAPGPTTCDPVPAGGAWPTSPEPAVDESGRFHAILSLPGRRNPVLYRTRPRPPP